jgi:hypothetical protein
MLVRREGRDRHGDYLDALKYAIDTAIVFRAAEGWPTGFSISGLTDQWSGPSTQPELGIGVSNSRRQLFADAAIVTSRVGS